MAENYYGVKPDLTWYGAPHRMPPFVRTSLMGKNVETASPLPTDQPVLAAETIPTQEAATVEQVVMEGEPDVE